jgi:hypothetical protein
VGEDASLVGPDQDAADAALDDRGQRPDRVEVLAAVGEVGAVAAIEPNTADDQIFVATLKGDLVDLLVVEVELGTRSAGGETLLIGPPIGPRVVLEGRNLDGCADSELPLAGFEPWRTRFRHHPGRGPGRDRQRQ